MKKGKAKIHLSENFAVRERAPRHKAWLEGFLKIYTVSSRKLHNPNGGTKKKKIKKSSWHPKMVDRIIRPGVH